MKPKFKTGDTVKLIWNNKVGKVLSVNPEQRRYIVSASLHKNEPLAYLCREEELFYILTPCISATPVNASYAKGVIIQFSFLNFSVAFGFVFTPKTIKKEEEK